MTQDREMKSGENPMSQSPEDIKRAKEIVANNSIISASISDGSLYSYAKAEGYIAGHAAALNSEAVQGLVEALDSAKTELHVHIALENSLFEIINRAKRKFQQFREGK